MISLWKCGLVTAFASALVSGTPIAPRQSPSTIYFFNFGDSYTQNGFAFDISGTLPSADNPTGHPALGTQTFSLGLAYPEWLVTAYNNTEVLDYDFGWGGATVDASVVAPVSTSIQTFDEQVTALFEPMFSSQDGGAVPWNGDNSIFSIFFGINDLTLSCADTDTQTAILDSYFSQATTLYNAGARKFLFIGVPPVDQPPVGCNNPNCDPATCSGIVNTFNGQLAGMVQPWAQGLSGVTTSIYDFHVFMLDVLANPTAYGFADATCAGDGGNTCIWQDQSPLHTGYTFQKILAQNMTVQLAPLGW